MDISCIGSSSIQSSFIVIGAASVITAIALGALGFTTMAACFGGVGGAFVLFGGFSCSFCKKPSQPSQQQEDKETTSKHQLPSTEEKLPSSEIAQFTSTRANDPEIDQQVIEIANKQFNDKGSITIHANRPKSTYFETQAKVNNKYVLNEQTIGEAIKTVDPARKDPNGAVLPWYIYDDETIHFLNDKTKAALESDLKNSSTASGILCAVEMMTNTQLFTFAYLQEAILYASNEHHNKKFKTEATYTRYLDNRPKDTI